MVDMRLEMLALRSLDDIYLEGYNAFHLQQPNPYNPKYLPNEFESFNSGLEDARQAHDG